MTITVIHTGDIAAALKAVEMDAERLERDFQTSQRDVVEQTVLSGGVDNDLRRNEPIWEIPEKIHHRCDVMNDMSLYWFIHLTDAIDLHHNRADN